MTTSADFPVTSGVFFPTYRGGSGDAFIAKLGTTAVPNCAGGVGNPPPPPGQTCCGHITSGGSILLGPNSRGGNNKGTFSAHARYQKGCRIQGSINYQDHHYGLHVHVQEITSFQLLPDQGSQGGAIIVGTGTVNNGGSHQVTVRLTDNGEPGRDDLFHIEVKGLRDSVTGAADYARGGDLADSRSGGGNVQIHKCKPGEVPAD